MNEDITDFLEPFDLVPRTYELIKGLLLMFEYRPIVTPEHDSIYITVSRPLPDDLVQSLTDMGYYKTVSGEWVLNL